MPKFEELSLRNLQKEVLDDPEIKLYLPDLKEKGKTIDRTFFYNILHTLHPSYVEEIVNHALELRNKAGT